MSAEQGLLIDICESPHDDVPRLVYADWLEEHDQPERAEFIRVQLELARLPLDDARRALLTVRQDELLDAHARGWVGPLEKFVSSPQFRRGFLEEIAIGVRQFMDQADVVFQLAPVGHLKLLRLSQSTIPLAEVAQSPHLARLRGLDVKGSELGDERLAQLLASPHLGNLEVLRLSRARPGGKSLKALAASPMKRLKRLELAGNELGAALRQLTHGAPAFRLEALDLADCQLSADALPDLLRWPGLGSVRELSLANNLLRVAAGELLAACPHLGALTSLDLRHTSIGGRGMQALTRAPWLDKVVSLDLGGNNVGRIGIEALVRSSHVGSLQGLRLASNNLRDRGVVLLAEWPGLARHVSLDLSNNDVLDQGAEALFASPHLGDLIELDLSGNVLGPGGAAALAACPRLKWLQRLALYGCPIGDAGARALIASPHMHNLA